MPNTLTPNLPNNTQRNNPFSFLASVYIVSLTPFNNKPESSRELTMLIKFFISSFDIISVVVPDPKIFLSIPASAANTAAVSPNRIKTLLTNGVITFLINGSPVCNNGPRSLLKTPPSCIILDNWVFDSLISVDELFAKGLRRFATYLLVNKNSCRKLVLSSELPIVFNDNVKTISVLLFIADFNLLSCEFYSFTFKVLYWAILYW